jgi:hypothetical protein
MSNTNQYPAITQDASKNEIQPLANEEIRRRLIEELGERVGQIATDATYYIENN